MMISRRNFLAVAGAAAAAAALTACGGSSSSTSTASSTASSAASEAASKIAKVALTCDTGTIDDESFNQACWTAVSSYMGDDCQYYIPEADASDEDRETMIRQAVNDGAEVIVCVGYLYGASLAWAAEQYPDVKFIAIDVTQGDIGTDEIPLQLLLHHLQGGAGRLSGRLRHCQGRQDQAGLPGRHGCSRCHPLRLRLCAGR